MQVFFEDGLETGVGMVLRNSTGMFVQTHTLVGDGLLRVDEVEAWGLLEAMRWTVSLGYANVIFEMDAKRVHEAILKTSRDDTTFVDYIKIISDLLSSNPQFDVI